MLSQVNSETTAPLHARAFAALAFGVVSFIIVFTNKIVLCAPNTSGSNLCYGFPSVKFLSFVQCVASCVVMLSQLLLFPRLFGASSAALFKPPAIPKPSLAVLRQIMPLPVFFFFNMITGLSATKRLNIPMFVLLRRFSIPMTMLLELYLLRARSTRTIVASVAAMLAGALVAASDDITIDSASVGYILLNDLFTALQGVVLKLKMNEAAAAERHNTIEGAGKRNGDLDDGNNNNNGGAGRSTSPTNAPGAGASVASASASSVAPLTSDGILFYNALFASVPALLWWLLSPEEVQGVLHFRSWLRPGFLFWFVASMFLGFVLNYCYFLCTKLNSALTSTVVGVAKNTVSTFVGMGLGDYKFSATNFTGICVSVFAALLYSYGEVMKSREKKGSASVAAVVTPNNTASSSASSQPSPPGSPAAAPPTVIVVGSGGR